MHSAKRLLFIALLIIFSNGGLYSQAVLAQTLSPEDSITYWKPFEISPDEDPKVKEAHDIFKRLLSGWEETRILPKLYVVHSEAGPWAASLDDGSILLSREAIDICFKIETAGGRDRLAFVLGHELAHQRADHLWHRRFFRLASQQPPQVRGRMLSDIPMDQLEIADLEAKETQADREGLLLMAITGFDPFRIAGTQSRFFTEWVESLWGEPCKKKSDSEACSKAINRTVRVQTYLQEIANRTVLFDLGILSYVAGRYADARTFFTAFGREFPRREIHNNIGLTHVGEAMAIRKVLLSKGEDLGPGFMFRYVLDDEPGIQKENVRRGSTRGGSLDPKIQQMRQEMEKQLNEAVLSFEKAIKLDPTHRESYWNLASTYLLMDNGPAAYGILAGNYVKRFGQDAMASMLLGIAAYLDGHGEKAKSLIEQAVSEGEEGLATFTRANLAAYLDAVGDRDGALAQWKMLADLGRKNGDEGLFRFALQRLGREVVLPVSPDKVADPAAEKIHGYTLNQRVATAPKEALNPMSDEVWVEGERLQIYRFPDGSRVALDANRSVIGLWQGEGDAATTKGIRSGDDASRLQRVYGSYGKKITTSKGEIQVLEKSGIAFYVREGKISGWFLIL